MSDKIKVTIQCKEVIEYSQEVLVTQEQFNNLSRYNDDEITERKDTDNYGVIEGLIDRRDALDCGREFTDFFIEPIND